MPDKQRSDFNSPKFKASAFIQYKKYEINVPVDNVLRRKKSIYFGSRINIVRFGMGKS